MFKKAGLLALTLLGAGLFIQPTAAFAGDRDWNYRPGYYSGYYDGRYYGDYDRDDWRRHERREREWREHERREWREHERWEREHYRNGYYYGQPSFYFGYRY
ncbi:MAG: hypothetical protein JOZ62_19220 [Acidobacteriaceae bacterium]|nr:hypothetical protein [Acidobacteriaceae bacterium]